MSKTLIINALLINEGVREERDILIEGQRIAKIGKDLTSLKADKVIDASGKLLIPGLIDDQVHFREPGLTHKGDLYSESRAAVAGGITSFMEMPNTQPQALSQALLEEKYNRAAQCSLANYSFYMGASNDNLEEVLKTDGSKVCGVKVFMGSSTGNMLVDSPKTLEGIFSQVPLLIATHCEDEESIRQALAQFKEQYKDEIPFEAHPKIRSAEACYKSSSAAVALAKKYGTRLHVLHISTAKELSLFDDIPLSPEKKITAEVCLHHLWFHEGDYAEKGSHIKWNPAVKSIEDRQALREAINTHRIDVLATDHAPHTLEEKSNAYLNAPSGGPLVQHWLLALMDLAKQGVLSWETLVDKAAHKPAQLFNVVDRGYIREGYFADLVLVNPHAPHTVTKESLLYKCAWSPFEGHEFSARVDYTWVNGYLAYSEGKIKDAQLGQRLTFRR